MKILNFKNINKILLIRLSSIGDVLLTSPLIRLLRKNFPDSQIDFAVSSVFSEILENNPHISNIFHYDKSKNLKELKQDRNNFLKSFNIKKYDFVIDLQMNLRSIHFRNGLSDNILKFRKDRLNKLFLVYLKKSLHEKPVQIPDRYISAAKSLNIDDDGLGLEFWLPRDSEVGRHLPFERKPPDKIESIAIAPGAHHFTKRWLAERFAELINKLKVKYNSHIIILGGKGDMEICSYIAENTNSDIENLCGATSLTSTAEIIDDSDLLITNDTGIMHIGAARQTPLTAIFGSTVTDFGFAPYRCLNVIIEKDIPCRPCTHIGRANCPKKHFNCMNYIEVDSVMEGVERLVGK